MSRKEYQEAPSPSIPRNSKNLEQILDGVKTIYVYPHHEILLDDDGIFRQTRSGPNWEGGIVTMTTCKHLLRTYSALQPESKKKGSGKVALCGITNKLRGDNFLLYVGVVDESFASNYELGSYLAEHHFDAYQKKLANKNRLGDIFEPIDDLDLVMEEHYDHKNFIDPVPDHCRREENDSSGRPKWIKDIEYNARGKVRPQCVTLNPVTVHTKPVYEWTGKLGRSGVVFKGDDAVKDFCKNLIGAVLL